MVIHPILGIITMGILNPIDGCMTIPFYEKTNNVLTTAHIDIFHHGKTLQAKALEAQLLISH
jgi:hypothetical protein